MYHRLGSRLLVAAAGIGLLISAVTSVLATFALGRLLGVATEQAIEFLEIWLPPTLVVIVASIWRSRAEVATVLGWSRARDQDASAPSTWEALMSLPAVVARGAIAAAVVVSL